MTIQRARRGFCLALLGWGLIGCNYFQGSSSGLDDEFADLELDDTPAPSASPPKRLESLMPADEATVEGELGLKLAVGDRFPLIKTVEQRLTQPGSQGPVTGSSRLELKLSLTVEEIRDGKTRFGVRYHGVRYLEQDLDGHRIEYNSSQAAGEIPTQVQAYAGLVNNGFSFWVGPDNRVIELVGFPDFVKRCVQQIPAAHRQVVIAQLTADPSDKGIASFVDDSIGLLPVSSDQESSAVAVRLGTSWDLPVRRIDGPIPMQISMRCMIKGLTDQTVEIDLFGEIAPVAHVDSPQGWKVAVRGGRCLGSCTVDRGTGLPTSSRVERYLNLVLQSPDGEQLEQQKEIITSIQAFPDQGRDLSGTAPSRVMPAQHVEVLRDSAAAEIAPPPPRTEPRRTADDVRLFR